MCCRTIFETDDRSQTLTALNCSIISSKGWSQRLHYQLWGLMRQLTQAPLMFPQYRPQSRAISDIRLLFKARDRKSNIRLRLHAGINYPGQNAKAYTPSCNCPVLLVLICLVIWCVWQQHIGRTDRTHSKKLGNLTSPYLYCLLALSRGADELIALVDYWGSYTKTYAQMGTDLICVWAASGVENGKNRDIETLVVVSHDYIAKDGASWLMLILPKPTQSLTEI